MVAKNAKNIYRQIAAVLFASLACIWAAIGYQIRQANQEALATAAKETDNLARIVSAHFSSYVLNLDAALQVLRREWIAHNGSITDQATTASDVLASHPPANLYVRDARGMLVRKFPASAPAISLDPALAADLRPSRSHEVLHLTTTLVESVVGEVFLNLTRSLPGTSTGGGTISLSVPAGDIIRLYKTLNLGTSGVITIRRPDGSVLIRSREQMRAMSKPIARAAFTEDAGYFIARSPLDQAERFFSYRTINELGLYVVVGYATEDVFATYFRQRRALFTGGVLCTAAILLLGFVIFRSLLRAERVARMLSEGEARFRSLASLSASWYWEQDKDLRFTAVEGQDMPFSESVGKSYNELPAVFSEVDKRTYQSAVAARESFRDIEYEVKERDGTTHYYSICGLPIFDSDKQFIGYRGTGRSITDRKTGEAKLLYLSRYDSLTGLPNRALMEDRLTQALAHAERTSALVALLFIDLDHFKRVNDSLGHPVGDELLKAVSRRLLRIVRKSDTVSRLGGDEFIVLLTEVRNINGVANIAKKIIAAVAEPHEIDKNVLYVSCSIGIAAHPMDGKTPQDLLKNADAALYHAKQHGRNNFQFFTSEINARLADRLVLESDLRRALQNGEFLLHYQKKIAAYSGQLTGVEALIRWQHPSRGLLHPSSFISVAEECGLIPRIGEWVLNEACRQNKDWQDRKLFEVPIAVNVSSLQFGQRSFVDSLDNALQTYSLRPEFLELELTESAVMKDGEESITILKRFKKKGVQITIDDFGTAYSSLNYLKRFPIDKVKIDKSFVSEIASDKIDFAIVGAIVTLAHSMGLKVVAEGVETATQRDLVSTHWCDELQGYLFGRPVDAVQFEQEIVSSEGAV